ncbi:hypothetical protein K505DRAFT_321313 [Melanomma pulvis-pyrius CBS 109.77]|uniref:Uncharacterized protein n=1 Tax=Melanomma pulvis-pyrius CBS 109.77 TaxID=1314802 RepID=A0A6A6XRS9_9PLEO|nr:hypothetical protein K505DRAFT_327933 [Melanomma pulvis-pyrius CBS 109.77]KAF2799140.1 hypothetical protein K505DRAFT_321313 [Melanomma pulvis-pyrius CBS 109.77]
MISPRLELQNENWGYGGAYIVNRADRNGMKQREILSSILSVSIFLVFFKGGFFWLMLMG